MLVSCITRKVMAETCTGPIPVNDVGLFSYMTIGWLTPLILRLFKDRAKEIRENDVWTCSELESCDFNTERLDTLWKDELQTHGRNHCSIYRVWFKFIWVRLLCIFMGVCLSAVVTFLVMGYIIDIITNYLEGPETSTLYAVGLVTIVTFGQLLRCASYTLLRTYATQTGIRFRSGVLGMTYKKVLKLKRMNGKIASEVITIFGSDALRVFMNTQLLLYILSMPLYLVIGIAFLYYLIGFWCFVSCAVFLVFYFIQTILIEIMSVLRRRTLDWTDVRIRKMTEVLASIKLIKMYAWEEYFKKSLIDIRKTETKPLLESTILNFIFNAIMPITPSLAAVVTIALFVNAGNELAVSTGFSIVATLGFMRNGLFYGPYAARVFGETMISFERIKRFLLEKEFSPPGNDVKDSKNAIELRDTAFMWDENSDDNGNHVSKESKRKITLASMVLRDINIRVNKGKHIGVCGTVGSGKSSLLQAVIGRMSLFSGHIAVDGTVAYVAQQAWIFHGTLRENILFGKPYKQEWYSEVLHACGLEPDLRKLANGDFTEIGDRGTNLSGGQKQRVSLARAVYSNSDIYLLDDPLSAVDGHVGQHLFHNCIHTVLKDKTVVLVTHQLQYLKECEEIYVMAGGEIAEHGSSQSLLTKNGHYAKLVQQLDSDMGNMCDENNMTLLEDDIDQGSTDINTTKQQRYSVPSSSCNGKGVLTERETSKIGEISMETYMSYVRAAGGKIVAVFVLLLYVCSISSVAFTDWWLGIWIKQANAKAPETLSFIPNGTSTNVSSDGNATDQKANVTSFLQLDDNSDGTNWYLTVYVFSTVGILGLATLKGVVAGLVTIKASVSLHNNAVCRIMSTPMRYFDANPSGRLLNRFSRDVEDADTFIPHMMDMLIQGIIMGIISLVTTAYNYPLFLIAVAAIGFYFYIIKIIGTVPIRNFKRLENVVRSPLLSHVTTSCNGLSTIVCYSQENNFMKGCKQLSDMTSAVMFLMDLSMRWMNLRLDIGGSVVTIITTIIVVFTKGSISPALAALSLTMCTNVASLIPFFGRSINEVESRFTSIERIHEYENLEIEDETGIVQVDKKWPSEGGIRFSNVEMKYRDGMAPVLKNINLDIPPKQKVGIVGRTGAGKSSLVAALFRLADLSDGNLFIDDVEIRTIPRKLLRSSLASIPQDPVLFAGTLRYNLDPFQKYTDEQVWAALDQAYMKEKMNRLSLTLDLSIEENGENFSVGERQLICLARAILRQNKILVMDEATASTDTFTDALIQDTVRDSFSDCTVLTISHRLNTVLHCDVVLVMDAGQVIEIGNPQALLQNPSSHFNSMIRVQNRPSIIR